jgi:uroporphyrinogen decarboxylase
MDDRFLKALKCQNEGRPPIWLMRQAGRYIPQYQAIRSRHSFLEMCHTPELIQEITHLPIELFGMDAAILFSDILILGEAMGMKLHFEDKVGPIFEDPLSSREDIRKLSIANLPEKLSFVQEGICLLKKSLSVPLIGFAGAPFTVASYLIEGRTSKTLKKTKEWMFQDPESFHALLDLIAEGTIESLKLQINAGVDALQLFDSWANFLAPRQFEEFSLRYMEKIVHAIDAPMILFCKNSSLFASKLASLNPAAISLDSSGNLKEIRQTLGPHIALQGNLDPDILTAPHAKIREEVLFLLESMEGDPGYIFNLGHGILPHFTTDAVKVVVDTVKEFSLCHTLSS